MAMQEYIPPDYREPKWAVKDERHCWRNYISEEVRAMWPKFTREQQAALARNAQEIADGEEWD